jgi:hypothetical protein
MLPLLKLQHKLSSSVTSTTPRGRGRGYQHPGMPLPYAAVKHQGALSLLLFGVLVCAAAAVIAGFLQPWPQELHSVDEAR